MKCNMDDYIRETPEILKNNFINRVALTKELVNEFTLKNYRQIMIIASGSSYNAAMCSYLFMQEVLGINVKVMSPYNFVNYDNLFLDDSFIIVASQSGNSTNSLNAVKYLHKIGIKTIGVTANSYSDFNLYCDLIINYQIGKEKVGFVTKGMVGLIYFFMLFALESSKSLKKIDELRYNDYCLELEKCADNHQAVYHNANEFYKKNRKELLSIQKAFTIGSGPAFGTALEGALKIGETLGICSFAYESEEFLHGPCFQINDNYTCFLIDNNDKTSERLMQIYHAVNQYTNRCYLLSSINHQNTKCITILKGNALIAPVYTLSALEYLAFQITDELKRWPVDALVDQFDSYVHIKSH